MSERHPRDIAVSLIELETLRCIHDQGPVWDGDVPSKAARTELVKKGLVAKICVKGNDGYQACTYLGREVLNRFREKFGGGQSR